MNFAFYLMGLIYGTGHTLLICASEAPLKAAGVFMVGTSLLATLYALLKKDQKS